MVTFEIIIDLIDINIKRLMVIFWYKIVHEYL